MSKPFADYLKEREVDSDTIQQATRYYVAELTGDLSPEDMREQLYAAAGNKDNVNAVLQSLERDSLAVENACLALLSSVWEEPASAEKIENTIKDAKTKLPIIESGLLAIVAMYSLYLLATGGKKREQTIVERRQDGTLIETTTKDYYGSTGPLSQAVNLLRPSIK